jgi:hypothetical protein
MYRVKLIGNRYYIQRRKLFFWKTVRHTHNAMLAQSLCDALNAQRPIVERRKYFIELPPEVRW